MESVGAWLPELNFLGIGLVLASVLQLFTIILGSLRVSGATVQQSLGVTVILPGPPITARLFPLFTLAGLSVLVAAVVLGVVQGLIASGYWDHSIAAELNPATPGDPLLSTLGTLEAMDRWVEPIKFVGLALLLAAAGLAARQRNLGHAIPKPPPPGHPNRPPIGSCHPLAKGLAYGVLVSSTGPGCLKEI